MDVKGEIAYVTCIYKLYANSDYESKKDLSGMMRSSD